MNNGSKLTDAILYMDGKPLETISITMANIEHSIPEESLEDSRNLRFSNKEYSGTFENVEFNHYNFSSMLKADSKQEYKVIIESQKYPRGNKLPKKKLFVINGLRDIIRKLNLIM